jgi:hypothetical protein
MPVLHEFVIRNFKIESGAVLPEAHVVYGTYGHLNAPHDNIDGSGKGARSGEAFSGDD